MTIVSIGEHTVGGVVPGCATACAEGSAGISAAFPDIQARIDALLAFNPGEISFAAQLDMATKLVAAITACMTLGLVPPSIAAQIATTTNLVQELLATLESIQAHADVLAGLEVSLGAAGVEAYAYDGAIEDLAGELDSELGADPGHCNALVLIVRSPVTWDALSNIMKVTP